VLHATRWRWWLAIAAVAWAVAVGFSRVYLGVHYPSDVLAGWAIASCVVGIGWLLFWADLRPQRFASVAPGARSEAAATRRGAVSSGPAADGDALPEPTGTDDRTLSGEE